MKTILMAAAALMLLAACDTAPKGGCTECEKMAMEANAKHKAEMAGKEHGKACTCCKGGMKHGH